MRNLKCRPFDHLVRLFSVDAFRLPTSAFSSPLLSPGLDVSAAEQIPQIPSESTSLKSPTVVHGFLLFSPFESVNNDASNFRSACTLKRRAKDRSGRGNILNSFAHIVQGWEVGKQLLHDERGEEQKSRRVSKISEIRLQRQEITSYRITADRKQLERVLHPSMTGIILWKGARQGQRRGE